MVRTELQGALRTVSAIASDPEIAEAVAPGGINGSAERKLKSICSRIGSQCERIFIADRDGVIRVDGTDPIRVGIRVGDRDYFLRTRAGMKDIGDPVFSRVTQTARMGDLAQKEYAEGRCTLRPLRSVFLAAGKRTRQEKPDRKRR